MGVNYHSSYSTLTLLKPSGLNPPIEDLDAALTYEKTAILACNGGSLSWDSTSGTLGWTTTMKVLFADPGDGKMVVNLCASGSIAIPANNVAFINLSTVDSATVSVTYTSYSTASTALIGEARFVLGAVDADLHFHPEKLIPHLEQMLNTAIGSSIIQHNVTSTSYHIGPSTFTEDNIMVFSSVGLPKDGGSPIATYATHAQQHAINSSLDHSGTIVENNIVIGSSAGLPIDSGKAISDFSTVAVQHTISDTAYHVGTAVAANLFIASTGGAPIDSGRAISGLLGGREATITCSAEVTVDFSTAETQVMVLTTNCTVTLSTVGIADGQVYRLRVNQDATGGWALTFNSSQTIHWRNATISPTITTVADYSDWLTFVRSQSTWYADAAQNFGG